MTPYYEEDGITIYHGDCREILPQLPDDSVHMVLTDPPYPSEFVALYGVLAQESDRILVSGGSLVTLCGHYQVPDVIDLIRPHLRYWWIGGMSHSTQVRLPGKWVATSWKPALWFVKSHRHGTDCPIDLLFGGGADKRFHEWGQAESWFEHWIQRLTKPAEVVLEPFVGGGTTLMAAKRNGRRAIGIEIEERYCEIAAKRLGQKSLPFADLMPRHENCDCMSCRPWTY